jgi:hypothetical protein
MTRSAMERYHHVLRGSPGQINVDYHTAEAADRRRRWYEERA